MTFLDEIETFLHQTGIQKSKFGKAITGNPNFVQRVIQGSKTKPSTVAKARAFMAEHRGVKIEPCVSQSEIDTAWQVYAAMSHFRRDNKVARENPNFTIEMNKAHDRWAALFTQVDQ
jgi:hypothetical protein